MTEAWIPDGLQRLLRIAAADPQFRSELLRRRSGLASPASVELTATERTILESIPEAQLATMIDGLPPPPSERRALLHSVAAAALLVLAGCPPAPPPQDEKAPPPEAKTPAPRKAIKCFGHLTEAAKAAGITDPCSPEAAKYYDKE